MVNQIYISGSSLVVPYVAKDSISNGITGLTVTFSVFNYANNRYWDNASGAFDSVTPVNNAATEVGDGLYNYTLTAGYVEGENTFLVRVIATESVTGDIADFPEVQSLIDTSDVTDIKAKTDLLNFNGNYVQSSLKEWNDATTIDGLTLDAFMKWILAGLAGDTVRSGSTYSFKDQSGNVLFSYTVTTGGRS